MRKFGTQYDEHWKENLFPGFASDMDWTFFNAAQPDQWGDAGEDWSGQPYALHNLHPTRPVLSGRLPRWQARAFIVRQASSGLQDAEGGDFEEVPMKLSTVWFFPDRERVGLIHHGLTEVREDDAAEVSHLMAAIENQDGDGVPRSVEHYADVLRTRLDPEWGALHSLQDEQLLPSESIAPWLELDEKEGELDALTRKLKAHAMRVREEAERERERHGLAPVDLDRAQDQAPTLPPSADIQDLPAYLKAINAFAEKKRTQMAQERVKLEQEHAHALARLKSPDPAASPAATALKEAEGKSVYASTQAWLAHAEKSLPPRAMALAGVGASGGGAMSGLRKAYQLSAQYLDPAAAIATEASTALRQQVEAKMMGDRDLSGMDLTGADLSGLDLRGAKLSETLLEGANLSAASLDDADLSLALLVRARLDACSFRGARLNEANLSLVSCTGTRFDGASLDATILHAAHFGDCVFDNARLQNLQIMRSGFTRCSFRAAQIGYIALAEGSALDECCFDGATIEKMALIGGQLRGCSFTDAQLLSCTFYDTQAKTQTQTQTQGQSQPLAQGRESNDFTRARLEATSFVGELTDLRGWRFWSAALKDCCLRDMRLDDADLCFATLLNCDFSGASMRRVHMTDADARDSLFIRTDFGFAVLSRTDFSEAVLQKADLRSANLVEANLFRADVSQIAIDHQTMLDGAFVKLVKTLPRRGAQPH